MKKRIIATLAILALFTLAIAAFAYTNTSSPADTAKACCCKDGSCPMKAKNHGEHVKMSCPMDHGPDQAAMAAHADADGCCGDSCPMKHDGASATASSATETGKNCCDDCACCKDKDKSAV